MKYTWEKEDIKVGRYIIRQSSPFGKFSNMGFMLSVSYMIGYSFKDKECKHKLISLADGMIMDLCETKEECAENLNKDSFGYRPMTKREMIKLLEYIYS